MEIEDLLLTPAHVLPRLKAVSKNRCCRKWQKRTAELDRTAWALDLRCLLERERLGTTGVGNGITNPAWEAA